MAKSSAAKQVFAILENDLYTKRALAMGIANVSAVAQMIRREQMPRASFVAIKAAVLRYAEAQDDYAASDGIKTLISKTEVSIRSGVSVVHVGPRFRALLRLEKIYDQAGEFAVIESDNAITIIVDDDLADDVLKVVGRASVLSVLRDQSVVSLISPAKIESTPGFVAFVTDLLARHSINVQEHYSCYTDTVFVLSKKDALRAYEILDSLG